MNTAPDHAPSPSPSGEITLIGRRILVVEDQALVAMALDDMLIDLGCVVVGPALNLPTAIDLASREILDGAVLDINLSDERSFPVALVLGDRSVPFLFATGYGERGLETPFTDAPVLTKPYSLASLERSLRDVLKAAKQL